jgi:hypothetical protein
LANALFDTLPASISESNGGNVDASERDLLRAAKMREKLLKQ